jgi:hypothetical protein
MVHVQIVFLSTVHLYCMVFSFSFLANDIGTKQMESKRMELERILRGHHHSRLKIQVERHLAHQYPSAAAPVIHGTRLGFCRETSSYCTRRPE